MSTFTNHNVLKAAMIKELERLQDELLDDALVTVKKRTKEDTGELRKSWKRDDDKITSAVEHAPFHEYGVKSKGIKAQRPVRKTVARIKRILKTKAREATNRL